MKNLKPMTPAQVEAFRRKQESDFKKSKKRQRAAATRLINDVAADMHAACYIGGLDGYVGERAMGAIKALPALKKAKFCAALLLETEFSVYGSGEDGHFNVEP